MQKPSDLRALVAGLKKKYPTSGIGSGLAVRPNNLKRVTTGSLMLDYVLGGGLPLGRMTIFYGKESSGKSTAAYRTMGNAQDLCANCFRFVEIEDVVEDENGDWHAEATCDCVKKGIFVPKQLDGEKDAEYAQRLVAMSKNSYSEFICCLVDVEGSFEMEWATAVGLDARRLFMVIPNSAEEGIDTSVALLQSGAVHLLCVDSIAALTPSKELEESTESWQMGLQARLVNKFARMSGMALNSTMGEYGFPPTMIWINQVRTKIGQSYGDTDSLPGGAGQSFLASAIVKFWAAQFKGGKEEGMDFNITLNADEKVKRANTVRTCFKIMKNKTAPPKAASSFVMGLTGSDKGRVVDESVYVDTGMKLGLIIKSSGKLHMGSQEFPSAKQMCVWLEENYDDKRVLRERLVSKMLENS